MLFHPSAALTVFFSTLLAKRCFKVLPLDLAAIVSRQVSHVSGVLVRQGNKHLRSTANVLPLLAFLLEQLLKLCSESEFFAARVVWHERTTQTDPVGRLHGSGKQYE